MASQSYVKALIWDATGPPPDGDYFKVLWREYASPSNSGISIPALIEEDALTYRSRYLAWIYELGELKIGSRKLVDHLEMRPGFSYWWMTLLVEKCNYSKSPLITDVIRLYAFEDWVKNNPEIKSIKLVSANHELIKCLKDWSEAKKVLFEFQALPSGEKSKSRLRLIFNRLPHAIQAGVWLLRYLIDRWPLRGVGVDKWRKTTSRVSFISYFFNLDPKAAAEGCFESHYWTKIPPALCAMNLKTAWLHIFVKNPVVPSAGAARKLIQKFNKRYKDDQTHVLLDSFLDFKTVLNTLRDYLYVRRLGRKLSKIIVNKEIKKSKAFDTIIIPLIEKDWGQSFFGIDAVSNLLTFNLFENAFASLPTQNMGVYLQENIGWEFGMIHAWRNAGHANLAGFPHATVRFWDLRYFFDPRNYVAGYLALPRPDFLAVSGHYNKEKYQEGGYPENELTEVEALRYLYLSELSQFKSKSQLLSTKPRRVLVLGDYLFANTFYQMGLLGGIGEELSNFELTVKPHPACPICAKDYPELKFNLSNQPLAELLKYFDTVYTSNVTSSAVDAYIAGLKVISILNPRTLNFNPLSGIAGIDFVSSVEELRDALLKEPSNIDEEVSRVKYFNIDASLPRWLDLLSYNSKCINY